MRLPVPTDTFLLARVTDLVEAGVDPEEGLRELEGISPETAGACAPLVAAATREVPRLGSWVARLLREHRPDPRVDTFWFGLGLPVRPDGSDSCDLYLHGMCTDRSVPIETRIEIEYATRGYASSATLAALHDEEVRETLDLALGFAGLCMASVCRTADPEILRQGASRREIWIGYPPGPHLRLGTVDASGFRVGWDARRCVTAIPESDRLEWIAECVRSGDPDVMRRVPADEAWAVAAALGRFRDRSASPGLIEALELPEMWARREAAIALGRIGDPGAVRPLEEALRRWTGPERWASAYGLGRLRAGRAALAEVGTGGGDLELCRAVSWALARGEHRM